MHNRRWVWGVIGAIYLQVIILLTVIEQIVFYLPYYESQYRKLQIFDAVEMEPKELLYVTKEMLFYLKDKRATLDIKANVAGIEKEFFTTKEKQHMEDVKKLFIIGYQIRRVSLFFLLILLFFFIWRVPKWSFIFVKSIQYVTGFLLMSIVLFSSLIMMNFSYAFTIFHKIFFTNDLWLLDYDIHLLIRIVPEAFFIDIFLKIGMFILLFLGLQWVAAFMYIRQYNYKEGQES